MFFSSVIRSGRFLNAALCSLISLACVASAYSISLDRSFGSSGIFTTGFADANNQQSEVRSVFVQPTGRVIMVGSYFSSVIYSSGSYGIAVAGVKANGEIDSDFGVNGKILIWESGANINFVDAEMTEGGGILLLSSFQASANGPKSYRLVRYTNQGSLDSTYNSDISIDDSVGEAVELSPGINGKTYVVLRRKSPNQAQHYVVRLNTNGLRDTTFGINGVITIDLRRVPSSAFIHLNELASGKFIVTGSHLIAQARSVGFAAKVDNMGHIDRSFGIQGIAIIDPSLDTFITPQEYMNTSIVKSLVQPDGKILLVGSAGPFPSVAMVARLNPRGRLDTGFGKQGYATFACNFYDRVMDLALMADGRIHTAGTCATDVGSAVTPIFVLTHSPSGIKESSATTLFEPAIASAASAIAIQPDGKIIAAGTSGGYTTGNARRTQFAAARYNP